MRGYLKEAAADPGLPHPITIWELPEALDTTDYFKMQPGIGKGSWSCGDDALQNSAPGSSFFQGITKTYTSTCRIDPSCPLFYYEVTVAKLNSLARTRMTVGMVWNDQGQQAVSCYYGDFTTESEGIINFAYRIRVLKEFLPLGKG